MARQTLEFMDRGRKIVVYINNPGNTYVTIVSHDEDSECISLRLKTLRRIVHHINRSHWNDDD